MCTTKFYKGPKCGHWWSELVTPCAEGRNFGNCPSFENGKARRLGSAPQAMAPEKSCPKCDKKNDYDGKKLRMISGVRKGIRVGMGPSRNDLGLDMFKGRFEKARGSQSVPQVVCCVVM